MSVPRLSRLFQPLWAGLLLFSHTSPAQSPKPRTPDLLIQFQESVKGQGRLTGFKNAEGKVAIPPQYAFASDFSQGYAVVFKTSESRFPNQALHGLIDTSGKVVLELGPWVDAHPDLFNLSGVPSSNLWYVRTHETAFSDGLLRIPIGNKRGIYIDPNGQWLDLRKFIPERHELGHFVDGWAPILAGNSDSDVRGFMDRKGNTLLVGKLNVHERAAPKFRCGLVLINPWEKENLYEFWDRTGTRVLGPFSHAGSFNAYGLACIRPIGPKGFKEPYYFIDPKGTKVLGPFAKSADFDRFGIAIVADPATPEDRYYIDAKGRRLGPVPKHPGAGLEPFKLLLISTRHDEPAPSRPAPKATASAPPVPAPRASTKKAEGRVKDM